jgi:NAD(P)-dependent dehydrogenase (short-subunit alcohol dehydrogenase family)
VGWRWPVPSCSSTKELTSSSRADGRTRWTKPSKLIGRNVTGVQGDSADLDDLDRLFDTVKQEKGAIDVLWASAGTGEQSRLGEITEEHFDAAFSLNARGTLFTVQKALPLFNDGGSIFMTGSNASLRGYPDWSVYAGARPCCPPTPGCGCPS